MSIDKTSFTVLVTGVAGFIGYHCALELINQGFNVLGIDNFSDYYSRILKESRLEKLKEFDQFKFKFADISDKDQLHSIFETDHPKYVIHLAAQSGVRYSLENPEAYAKTNLVGFFNVIDCCREFKIIHFVYASSSSVYGSDTEFPLQERNGSDHPLSFYAATKRSNELMAHSYSHVYGLPTSGLRFFTVYGPWGRPDMAPMIFAKAISEGKPLKLFNCGKMKRDFTYVGDIAKAICLLVQKIPNIEALESTTKANSQTAPFRVLNIGNEHPIEIMDFVRLLENKLGKKAIIDLQPMQIGEVEQTFSDSSKLYELIGYKPQTSFETGISHFAKWYQDYYSSVPVSC